MKTPNEKAKELITKFSKIENRLTYIDTKGAKICALLCIDEQMQMLERIGTKSAEYEYNDLKEIRNKIYEL